MAKEKIVVIDDSPIVRKLAELALEAEGYKVYTAEDGEEGLRIAEEVRPSVILVDFIMPRISGYQFCKSARENELLKDIPIILITGKGEDVGKKFAEKFGVADYFIKPFKSEMLVEKVNSIIHAQRLQMGEEALALEKPTKMEEPVAGTPFYALEVAAAAEEPGYEVPGIAAEPVHVFEAADIHPGTEFEGAKEVEEPQALSFAAAEMQEEQELSFRPEAEEAGLAAPAFDFNIEGMTDVQEIETEEEGRIGMPDFPGVYDFETMQEIEKAAPAKEVEEPVARTLAGTDIEAAVDKVVLKYFADDLPLLIEKSVEDILKRYGIIKPSTILFSGSLEHISSVEILKLIETHNLTGKFLAFSPSGSAEIYFENGLVVFALTSKHGKTLTSRRLALMKKGPPCEIGEGLKESMIEAVSMVAGLKEGGFFFEKVAIPETLLGLPERTNFIFLIAKGGF